MRSYSLLLVAAASAVASAQSLPTTGCTSNSFAIPSWLIEDLEYTAAGKTSFHITNRATNYTADLTCSPGSSGWNACAIQGKPWSNDTLQVSVQISETSAQVMVNQTWTCNDRNGTKLMPFTAVGNDSVALKSDGHAVNSPWLIKGSLLSPVTITPKYAWGPTGHDKPGCAATPNASWILSAPFYMYQTGDGVTAIASQDFNVLLTNAATGYQASCMSGAGFGDGLTPTPASGPLNLVCAGSEFQSSGGGKYSITTAASFDPSTFRFTVNQTWYCDDLSPASPVQVTASASESLPLTCTSASVGTDGAFTDTKTTCINPSDVTLAAQLLLQSALVPYSIEDPVPGPDGCTLSSIFHPQWTFSAFEVDSTGTNASSTSFEIILRTGSPGFQFPISISQDTTALAGDGSWYSCIIGPSGDIGQPLWPTSCSFKYQATTQELSLRAEWSCSELDPDHPIIFSGITTTTVNSPLACETVEGVSQCVTADGAYSWTANISNVTWHQTP
ncbi:hypothetical protein CONLIGDRAFT_585806 [Coniochaeta ligniaria NRRL 30616]|uniref:Ig-like domain-containing protein n=1 Tax=Coniochaeta ligniaria NRRL 30616 TaxID=1408157 RepID=A0A1J7J0M3_9PEZI|nr:hypothetical protein CONLIGDRAFT_585806 [Coniochaeta ligniaria NRRL 30616]